MFLLYVTGADGLDTPEVALRTRRLLHNRFVNEPISTIVLTRGRKGIHLWAKELAEACGLSWVEYKDNGLRYSMRGLIEPWCSPGMVLDTAAALLSDVTTKLAKGWAFEAAVVGGDCFPCRDPVLDFAGSLGCVVPLPLAWRGVRPCEGCPASFMNLRGVL